MIMDILAQVFVVLFALAIGIYGVTAIDCALSAKLSGVRASSVLLTPLYRAASLWVAPSNQTEAPDTQAWRLAPVLYLMLAAMGLALVPWTATFIPVDLTIGIVLWGAL